MCMYRHRSMVRNPDKQVVEEFIDDQLQKVIDEALEQAGLDCESVDAIAVSLGPGETFSRNKGIDLGKYFIINIC